MSTPIELREAARLLREAAARAIADAERCEREARDLEFEQAPKCGACRGEGGTVVDGGISACRACGGSMLAR